MLTRLFSLLMFISISSLSLAQFPEFAKYAEMKTGIFGSIAHETAESEVFDKKDFAATGFGFIKNGATFELLNTLVVKHPKYNALNMILIKVTYDPEGKHTGRIGWVHVKATTLNSRFNASSMRIDGGTAVVTVSSHANHPEVKTGLWGTISESTGKEVFDMKDFSAPSYGSGFLKNGATFDLLSFETVKHPTFSLDMILIRVTHDPDNSYTGKTGWVYVKATSLFEKFNPNTLKIEANYKSNSATSTGSSSYAEFAAFAESKTGIYGSIAHETSESEVFDKKDFGTPGHGFIKNGATFDLLNTKVIKHPKYPALDMVLIRVTFDPENKYTGKVGWVHVSATSLRSRVNTAAMKVE